MPAAGGNIGAKGARFKKQSKCVENRLPLYLVYIPFPAPLAPLHTISAPLARLYPVPSPFSPFTCDVRPFSPFTYDLHPFIPFISRSPPL